jgi:hypothetical protein
MGWACLNIRTKERDRLDQVVRRVKEVAMSSGALSTTRRSDRCSSWRRGRTWITWIKEARNNYLGACGGGR